MEFLHLIYQLEKPFLINHTLADFKRVIFQVLHLKIISSNGTPLAENCRAFSRDFFQVHLFLIKDERELPPPLPNHVPSNHAKCM